jgi:hypothetical protein
VQHRDTKRIRKTEDNVSVGLVEVEEEMQYSLAGKKHLNVAGMIFNLSTENVLILIS